MFSLASVGGYRTGRQRSVAIGQKITIVRFHWFEKTLLPGLNVVNDSYCIGEWAKCVLYFLPDFLKSRVEVPPLFPQKVTGVKPFYKALPWLR